MIREEDVNKLLAVKSRPIGMMDSGMGGLSVLRVAIKNMPDEDFIYYGDTENAPYGTKTREEIQALTLNAVGKLVDMGVKAVVIACNTATTNAIDYVRERFPQLIIVGIEPAVRRAAMLAKGKRAIIISTPATSKQEKVKNLVERYGNDAEIINLGMPGLMEFVEQDNINYDVLKPYFDEHLKPYLNGDVRSLALGCTHYPFLKKEIARYLEAEGLKDVAIIDGSDDTVAELIERLVAGELMRPYGEPGGNVKIYNSLIDEEKNAAQIEFSKKLLAMEW